MISCVEQPWAAIRKSIETGEEFIDMTLVNMDKDIILDEVYELRYSSASWDRDNPVVRVSRCVLTETPGRAK